MKKWLSLIAVVALLSVSVYSFAQKCECDCPYCQKCVCKAGNKEPGKKQVQKEKRRPAKVQKTAPKAKKSAVANPSSDKQKTKKVRKAKEKSDANSIPVYRRLYVQGLPADGSAARAEKQPKVVKVRPAKKAKTAVPSELPARAKADTPALGAAAVQGLSAAVSEKAQQAKEENKKAPKKAKESKEAKKRNSRYVEAVAKAIEEDRFASVQDILDKVDPNDIPAGKMPLFNLAVFHSRFYFVRHWLKDPRVADILKRDTDGIVCVPIENYSLAKDPNVKNLDDANRHAVLGLLLKGGANPNALCHSPQDAKKAPAVYVAAGYWGDSVAVRYLVESGAKVDFDTVSVAASWAHSGIVDFLLKAKPDLDKNQLNACGENLLFDAVRVRNGRNEVDAAMTVDVLLKAGVNKNIVAQNGPACIYGGLTPLQVAQREKLPLTAEILSR